MSNVAFKDYSTAHVHVLPPWSGQIRQTQTRFPTVYNMPKKEKFLSDFHLRVVSLIYNHNMMEKMTLK